ncbi:MAG: HD domain-containing protein [Lachnospiraceae bacterium]|nr:HD domain-containing protein [Lachnospiraceae bacterium]
MNMLDKAIIFAVEQHAGMVRKGTDVPYIVHPLEAAAIAASLTSDQEILAAAVLHDVVEDTAATLEEIRAEFGERIAALVASDSEDKMTDIPAAESWKLRKAATIEALKSASYEEKIVALADKLSNIRAIHRDYVAIGDKVWERFNQKDKKEQEWYYQTIAAELAEFSACVAYGEYCRLVEAVFG